MLSRNVKLATYNVFHSGMERMELDNNLDENRTKSSSKVVLS